MLAPDWNNKPAESEIWFRSRRGEETRACSHFFGENREQAQVE